MDLSDNTIRINKERGKTALLSNQTKKQTKLGSGKF